MILSPSLSASSKLTISANDPSAKKSIPEAVPPDNIKGKNFESEVSARKPANSSKDIVEISAEAREIAQLATRDREVRAHEAAHAAVGGQYAGSPTLTYRKGPDGRSYAAGGEVSIDTSPVSGDPLATLQKAATIRAAALAPAQPSAQDLRVASRAAVMAAKAQSELSKATTGTQKSHGAEGNEQISDRSDNSASTTTSSLDSAVPFI